MYIPDDWSIEDAVSGLRLQVIPGKYLNRLHIERFTEPLADNRDFFFTKDGAFDGTGCALDCNIDDVLPPESVESVEQLLQAEREAIAVMIETGRFCRCVEHVQDLCDCKDIGAAIRGRNDATEPTELVEEKVE